MQAARTQQQSCILHESENFRDWQLQQKQLRNCL